MELARCFLCQGQTDQALEELEKALARDATEPENVLLLGHIQTIMGHYRDAETAYRQLLEEDRTAIEKSTGRKWLGLLYLLQGQNKSCLREIEESIKLARTSGFPYEEQRLLLSKASFYFMQRDFDKAYETALRAREKAVDIRDRTGEIDAFRLKGLCEVERGQFSEARRTIMEMENIIDKIGLPKLLRTCYQVEGALAAARKSWDIAVDYHVKAVSMLPEQYLVEYDEQAVYYEALASAYRERGDEDQARAQYERLVSLTTGRLTGGDAYVRSLYQLGIICQEKNETGSAREYFKEFLSVLENADSQIPQVEDARKRLASIS
jgi:tetratricopeptide (TPR) repeat protein